MVARIAIMCPPGQEPVIRIRAIDVDWIIEGLLCRVRVDLFAEGCIGPQARWNFVDVGSGELMNGSVSDVPDLQARLPGKAVFDGQVPLPGVGHFIGGIDSADG